MTRDRWDKFHAAQIASRFPSLPGRRRPRARRLRHGAAAPRIAFAQVAPIKLDVREIEVERAYQPPHAAPNVEHLFAVPPAAAATLWAVDRLVAVGPLGRARFIVREASVVEIPLEQSGGLTGAFTTEQSERYDARLVV